MPENVPRPNMTIDEYLEFEGSSTVRHEYVAGQVFAMTGATVAHNVICTNMLAALRSHLQGSGCRAFINDLKVHVEATNSFYYPDLVVSCEPLKPQDQVLKSPVLIVEVLSPSTKHIDRREKLAAYYTLKSLREYVVVFHDRKLVEFHVRLDGRWIVTRLSKSGELCLQALPPGPLRLPVETIYDGLDLPQVVKEQEEEYAL